MRRGLSLTSIVVLLYLFALFPANHIVAQDDKKPEHEQFGSSLRFLKWDPVSNHAIDFGQMYKTPPNRAKRPAPIGTGELQYTIKKPERDEADVNLQTTLVVF